MWGKYIVTARHRASGKYRTFEVGCSRGDALTYGRIWFPEDQYEGHTVSPKEKDSGN